MELNQYSEFKCVGHVVPYFQVRKTVRCLAADRIISHGVWNVFLINSSSSLIDRFRFIDEAY